MRKRDSERDRETRKRDGERKEGKDIQIDGDRNRVGRMMYINDGIRPNQDLACKGPFNGIFHEDYEIFTSFAIFVK